MLFASQSKACAIPSYALHDGARILRLAQPCGRLLAWALNQALQVLFAVFKLLCVSLIGRRIV